jgi:hypothetical protein
MNVLAFFRRQLLVARVYGIPVRIELSWFIVCALSIWLVAMSLQSGPQYFSKMVAERASIFQQDGLASG